MVQETHTTPSQQESPVMVVKRQLNFPIVCPNTPHMHPGIESL